MFFMRLENVEEPSEPVSRGLLQSEGDAQPSEHDFYGLYDELEQLAESLPKSLPRRQAILAALEDCENLSQLRVVEQDLRGLLDRRKKALLEQPFLGMNFGAEQDKVSIEIIGEATKGIDSIIREIESRNFAMIGDGSTCQVYVNRQHPRLCFKW